MNNARVPHSSTALHRSGSLSEDGRLMLADGPPDSQTAVRLQPRRSDDYGSTEEWMIARLLVTIGSVGASVGLLLYGMGVAYVEADDTMVNGAIAMMIIGVIMTIVGAFMYRASERGA
jgi:hypothetical protein